MINIQSTLRTTLYLCKNVSPAVLLASDGNSYTLSMQPDMFIYTYILHSIQTMVEQNKSKKRQQLRPRAILKKRAIGSSALVYIISNVRITVNYEAEKCEKMVVFNKRHVPVFYERPEDG
jgi:hypothetical protein